MLLLTSGRIILSQRPVLLLAEESHMSLQALAAQAGRVGVALASAGAPLNLVELRALHTARASSPELQAIARIQQILDAHVLLEARVNPEGRVSVTRGLAKAELVEHGWRTFLIKVQNEAAITAPFKIYSPQGEPTGQAWSESIVGVHDFTNGAIDAVEAAERWVGIDNYTKAPLQAALSGLEVEYRVVSIYSRENGKREASLEAVLGDEEQDLGFRSTLAILFDCLPSRRVSLQILDDDGSAATASLLITDKLNRVYPAQNKRLLPDLWFEPHVYRSDGETIVLPEGEYRLEYGRGPEYLRKTTLLSVSATSASPMSLHLERWVSPRGMGYYSGDTHIHAAGCSHYASPSEGVPPEVMYRQVKGEALDVGDVLTWGPGYYYQKQFFSGHVENDLQSSLRGTATLRYDVEVSGFPSSHCGHLVLLRLKEQDYPGTTSLDQWPSWNVPILAWAKKQGALAGYAHSGHGLNVASTSLPNYLMPPFDSMGANEFIADVTHDGLVDFISGCDTRPFAELNIWYHTLNCGFRTAFVGETDFPCLSDERVGGGRTYIQLQEPPSGDKGYAEWVSGITTCRSYAGDGRSHLFNLNLSAGPQSVQDRELKIVQPGTVRITAVVCALLAPEAESTEYIRRASPYDKPYWHIERARVDTTRNVPVELVVNGEAVQRREIVADGSRQAIAFEVEVEQSSWIALRILPSSHTNPLYVLVDNAPVRASSKSAQWCRAAVDVCWAQKSKRIRPSELSAAAAAFDHARATYDRVIEQCTHG